ncbi:transcriptional repressor [Prolixibacter sp. SD074]|uniref:Fur family transcriptional regulator n=1 Tax=Prolixibacter sp. SD074 TaxID=2652391 RepID=UPI00129945B5|nr:transcriptional repressor [Prolixibacter sp. SD074]
MASTCTSCYIGFQRVLFNEKGWFNASCAIWPELEQKFEKADKVTLYRTLKTFQKNKLIHSIDDGTGSVKYALCHDTCECHPEDLHVHFLCAICNQTFCLNDIPVPTINLPNSFSLESVNMVVKGICSNCKK